MPISTAQEFFEVLQRSRLLSSKQLDTARELTGNGNGGADAAGVARALARKDLLTRWQAGQLLAGRSSFYLGKYKLIELLGRGGMGSVFLAEHTTMNRRVALKVLSREIGKEPGSLDRFFAEARAIAALAHPNIVHAYDVDSEGDRYYIVMEFVDGVDLARMVAQQGPLDFDSAADYIRQAADGLAHAHAAKVIHCDIKPSNLLVNQQGVVKILDMGLARLVGGDEIEPAQEGGVLGSVDYLAPEQAVGATDFDHRADIYSLGCTFYYLLTGHPPFPEGTLPERIMKHQTQSPEPIARQRPDVPTSLARICEKMMAKRPEDRYQGAVEVSKALSQWKPPARKLKPAAALKRAEALPDDNLGADAAAVPLVAAGGPPRKAAAMAGGAGAVVVDEIASNGRGTPGRPGAKARKSSPSKRAHNGLLLLACGVLLLLGVVLAAVLAIQLFSAGGDEKKTKEVASADDAKKSADTNGENKKNADEGDSDEKAGAAGKKEEPKTKDESATVDSEKPSDKRDPKSTKPDADDEPKHSSTPKPVDKPKVKDEPEGDDGDPLGLNKIAGNTSPKIKEPKETKPKDPKETKGKNDKPPAPPKPQFVKLATAIDVGRPGEAAAADGLTLGDVKLEGNGSFDVKLFGGRTAIYKGRDQFVLARDPAGDRSYILGLEPRDGSANGEVTKVARVWLDGELLKFQWEQGVEDKRCAHIRNCALRVDAMGESKFVALGKPQQIQPLTVDLDTCKAKEEFTLESPPESGSLRIELMRFDGQVGKVDYKPGKLIPIPERATVKTPPAFVVVEDKALPNPMYLHLSPHIQPRKSSIEMFIRFSEDVRRTADRQGREFMAGVVMLTQTKNLAEQQANAEKDKKKKEEIEKQANSAKQQLEQLQTFYKKIHKTARLQFRIVSEASDKDNRETHLVELVAGHSEAPVATTEDEAALLGDDKDRTLDDDKPAQKKKGK